MNHSRDARNPRTRRSPWPVFCISLAVACTQTGVIGREDGRSGDAGLDIGGDGFVDLDAPVDTGNVMALSIDPPTATLRVIDRVTPVTQRFTARGRTSDGRDVPVAATWSIDRTDVANINASGDATTTNNSGGDAVVTARFGSLSATAALRVILDLNVVLPGSPPGIEAFFPPGVMPTVDAMRTPAWLYPANGAIFPQNVYKVLFQWRPAGNDRFRLTFESDRLRLSLYSDGVNPICVGARTGLTCLEPTLEIWRFIAASNPRASVRVTIDAALSTAPGRFYRSSALTIGFSRGPVPGAIYYWSTTARGVRRATVSDAAPTNFLTPDQADGDCVACHTLSRRGNRMAADVGGEHLWVVEVSPTFPPPRVFTQYRGAPISNSWSTFAFDETRVVSATNGVMTLRNSADGAPINTVPLPAMRFGTQPDWAPDNSLMVFVLSTANRDRGVDGGQIATVEIRPSDGWGTVRTLAGSGIRGDTNMFPSFSWDSQWIAYAHSTRNGENDLTTDLWLMRRDGMDPRALARANTVVSDRTVTTATIQDNMPTWAPSGVPDDYAWIAFSSTRDYGGVLTTGSAYGQREQLWVAAIDLTAAATGAVDPSAPAFRLPFTELAEDTHRPFWAEDRVRPGPDAGVDSGADATPTDGATSDTMCAMRGQVCTRDPCCGTLTCWSDGRGGFACTDTPM